jgi:hypothetical protein
LHFQTNYTWAKGIDDAESRGEIGGGAGNAYMNVYNRRLDRGLSGNSIAHRSITSVVYELPVGQGRRFSLGGPGNWMMGGWTLGYIGELRSGAPWGVIENVNRTNAFAPQNRPNVVGNPKLADGRPRADFLRAWFDINAFAEPALYTFGNAGRINGFGPGSVSMDLSILKDMRFRERVSLQFRTEMLNFTNTPSFGLPALNRGAPAFGRITSLVDGNQARIIQFGLHLKY